jgi:hypothetical protein
MNATAWTLRVAASRGGAARVCTRRHQFTAGRPLDFDAESDTVSAFEYALGAVGAELVGGLQAFARRRRIVVDDVEALVTGEVEHALAYLEVVGEPGPPRIGRIHVKLYVSSPEDPQTVRRVLDEAVARLPLVGTLRETVRLEIDLALTA